MNSREIEQSLEWTPQESREAFEQCRTWSRFQYLMTLSVFLKIPSPVYGFSEDVGETDNGWWTAEDPRYALLKEINFKGLITLNAQETVHEPGGSLPDVFTRAGVVDQCARTSLNLLVEEDYLLPLKHAAEAAGFIVIVRLNDHIPSTDEVALVTNIYRDGRQDIISSIPYAPMVGKITVGSNTVDSLKNADGGFFDDVEQFLNDGFAEKVLDETFEITVIDRVCNRPAHHPSGLFTFVANYVAANPVSTPFDV
jgi:hypothetical protein